MHPINELISKGEASSNKKFCWESEGNVTVSSGETFNQVLANEDLTVQVGNHWKDFEKGIYLLPVHCKSNSASISLNTYVSLLKPGVLTYLLCFMNRRFNKYYDSLLE